jgi:hypothetical protein
MGWFDQVKSYVWDAHTTPYLISVPRLSRPQAEKELFAYVVFLTLVAAAGTVAVLVQAKLHGSPVLYAAALHGASVVAAALYLGFSADERAARYCITAPVAAFLGFVTGTLNPNLSGMETLALAAFTLAWLRYSLRVVALARAYPDLPEAPPDPLPPSPPSMRRRRDWRSPPRP